MNNMFKKEITALIKDSKAKFGIAISDFKSKNIFLYNADEVFPAASVIKIPIFIELFRQAQNKKIKLNKRVALKNSDKIGGSGILAFLDEKLKPTVLDLAKLMIALSDNTATGMIIDIIGMEKVNKMMRQLGIVKTVLGRKPHIDPNAALPKNFATPRDILILLEKIYNNEFLQPKYRDMIVNILLLQQDNGKLSANFPENVKFAHKTGEISNARGDAGIVLNTANSFIMAVLTKDIETAKKTDETMAKIGETALNFWGR